MTILDSYLRNKIFLFTLSRYIGYCLIFLRGLLLAGLLGPFYFGIWGFISLITEYLVYTNLGMQFAVNVELSIRENNEEDLTMKTVANSTLFTCSISLLLIVAGAMLAILNVPLFPQYEFRQFVIPVSLFAAFSQLNSLFTNIYRSFELLWKIAVSELLFSVLPLACIPFFYGETLISAMLYSMAVAYGLSVAVFVINPPFPIRFRIDVPILKNLLRRGMSLLIYNISFYLILMMGKTIVGAYYPVKTMGYYSFANGISAASLLGLNAVLWVVYPRILNKLKSGTPEDETKIAIERITLVNNTIVFLIVSALIACAPILYVLFPDYGNSFAVLRYLLLSQFLLSCSAAFSSFSVSRNQGWGLAKIGFQTIVVTMLISVGVAELDLDFSYVGLALCLGSILYSWKVTWFTVKSLLGERRLWPALRRIIPAGIGIPISVIIVGTFMNEMVWSGIISLLLFLVFSYKSIVHSIGEGKNFLLKYSIS